MSNEINSNDLPNGGQGATSNADFENLVTGLLAHFRALNDTHPEYMTRFDDCDLDCAPRQELVELLNDAPDEKVRYFLLSKYTTRLTIAKLTGRAFQ